MGWGRRKHNPDREHICGADMLERVQCSKAQECLFSGLVDSGEFDVQEIYYTQIYLWWSLTTDFITYW